MQVLGTFEIEGRGLAVAVEKTTDLPHGGRLTARIVRPDGTTMDAEAFRERFLRRGPGPAGQEASLLVGLSRADVPVGSALHLEVAVPPDI